MTGRASTTASTVDVPDNGEQAEHHTHFEAIAAARYLIRKMFRMMNDEAKKAGLDSLQYQALLQIYGGEHEMLYVNELAERLDIVPAFASKLVKGLDEKGLVSRTQSKRDKRIIEVRITDEGRATCRAIDQEVRVHVEYFQKQRPHSEKKAALKLLAFYLGIDIQA